VNDIVVLIPAKITDKIKISWEPTPVYFKFELNGVINVQPAVTKVLAEHFDTKIFFLLVFITLSDANQKDSGYFETIFQNINFNGRKLKVS